MSVKAEVKRITEEIDKLEKIDGMTSIRRIKVCRELIEYLHKLIFNACHS